MPRSRPTATYYNEFVSLNGDGTGEIDMVGDYSSSEGIFYLTPGGASKLLINRLIVTVQDTGAFDAAKYGNNVTLTAGIVVEHVDSGDTLVKKLTPRPILTNTEWGSLCYDVVNLDFGIGDEILLVRWTLGKAEPANFEEKYAANYPIYEIPNGEKIRVRLNDDLSGLVKHRICVQGLLVTPP
jgi:hypothetical protein